MHLNHGESSDQPIWYSLNSLQLENQHFLSYAVENILHHTKIASTRNICQRAFPEDFDYSKLSWMYSSKPSLSLPYYLAKANSPCLLHIELGRAPCIDVPDSLCGSTLYAAVRISHETIIRTLLTLNDSDKGIIMILYINMCDSSVYEKAARALLERKPRMPQFDYARSFLSIAAENGENCIVEVLISTQKGDLECQTEAETHHYRWLHHTATQE